MYNMYNQFSIASLYSGHLVNFYKCLLSIGFLNNEHFLISHGCPLCRGFTVLEVFALFNS